MTPELIEITPDDNRDLPYRISMLYVGAPGLLVVQLAGQTEPVTIVTPRILNEQTGEHAGWSFPAHIDKVFATGTTAAHLIGVVA